MIVVLGPWPRSGTSMVMAMLTAGGLKPIRNDEGTSDACPSGSFQHDKVLTEDPVGMLSDVPARSVVKLFPRHVKELLDAGVIPSRVVITNRPYGEHVQSWVAAFPERGAFHDEETANRHIEVVRLLLDESGVPVLDVDFHGIVDSPAAAAKLLADFCDADLDTAAMAAVPAAKHRHFGVVTG